MTLPEVVDLRAVIESLWPNAKHLDDGAVRIWHQVLASTDLDAASSAVVAMNREGREWEPTPGMIASACEPLGHALPYAEAKQLVLDAMTRFGVEGEADGLRWLAGVSPQAARWAASSWRTLCLAPINGDHGGIVDRDWRADYRAVCDRMDSERSRGRLVPQVSNRLAQLERGQRQIGGSLRAVDFTAALGGEQAQIEAGE